MKKLSAALFSLFVPCAAMCQTTSFVSYDSRPAVAITQAAPGAAMTVLSSYPSFTEYRRSGSTSCVQMGALGSLEANMTYNMDYSSGLHRFCDTSKDAYWTALNEAGLYLQYAPKSTAAGDVWDNSGNQYAFFFSKLAAKFNGDVQTFLPGAGRLGIPGTGWKQLYIDGTNSATVGAVTINKAAGRINIAAGQDSIVVTDSVATASAHVFASVSQDDATAQIKNVVPSDGSFKIKLVAPATDQTSIDFFIVN